MYSLSALDVAYLSAGSSTQTRCSPYRSSSLSLIPTLSTKVLAPAAQKNPSPSTDSSTISHILLRVGLDYDSCSCDQASTFQELSTRLDFVSVFVRQENSIPLEKLGKSMRKIKNMRMTTTLLRKGINGGNQKYGGFKSGVWASLLDVCIPYD